LYRFEVIADQWSNFGRKTVTLPFFSPPPPGGLGQRTLGKRILSISDNWTFSLR